MLFAAPSEKNLRDPWVKISDLLQATNDQAKRLTQSRNERLARLRFSSTWRGHRLSNSEPTERKRGQNLNWSASYRSSGVKILIKMEKLGFFINYVTLTRQLNFLSLKPCMLLGPIYETDTRQHVVIVSVIQFLAVW